MTLTISYQSPPKQNAALYFDGTIYFGFEVFRYWPYNWLAKKSKEKVWYPDKELFNICGSTTGKMLKNHPI
jgi:hypothetical protein